MPTMIMYRWWTDGPILQIRIPAQLQREQNVTFRQTVGEGCLRKIRFNARITQNKYTHAVGEKAEHIVLNVAVNTRAIQ
jgi:hypothetical protein